MVRIWRFERQAYALGERRSIQLSYIRIYQYFTTKGRLLLRNLTSCLGGEPSIQLRYRDIYVLSLIFDFSALCMECFSQRSDRLRCNRNGVKLVASKIVEKTSIPGLAFD